MEASYDLIVVGAGPAGLAAASHAHDCGSSYVLLEKSDHLSDTIFCYQARKYVMAEPAPIPLRGAIPFAAGSRESILEAWNDHAQQKGLRVELSKDVRAIERNGAGFRVRTADGATYAGRNVVLGMGTQGSQRKPNVPGEDLPHVEYRLVDPDAYADRDILVVGAGDSAIEIALALADANRVALVVRSPEILRAKESLTREVLTRAGNGSLTVYYSTTLRAIHPDVVDLNVRGEVVRVPANHIFLKLGADPPRKFFESVGIAYTGPGADAAPVLSQNYETSVPGLFLIGAASGRDLIKSSMNQGWEVVEHLEGRPVEPADEQLLREKLPFLEGSVFERIRQLQEKIPLFGAASDEQIREMLLSTSVRDYA
ncbi:MAG TPA: NAD(P)-binding domain-containing protein, partial [Thermoanaerobaculia bacterium]|nr:NAD(P)-binding domain-containing protein [Thermoanaerobaculia bacterium]